MVVAEGFDDIGLMFPEELKTYMDTHKSGTFTLLDVRQPVEYEEAHLPGAQLVPLPRLINSLGEVAPDRPTIVYCAVGGRSRMAAQLLIHQGYKDVHHLVGGIEAWEEARASGPVEFHLQFIRGDETRDEIVKLAYRMEEGLRRFHEAVKEQTNDPELARALTKLIQAEEKHKATVLSLIPEGEARDRMMVELSERAEEDLMEGGMNIQEFMKHNQAFLSSVKGYLNLAMMVETQALDLYLRMAAASREEASRGLLYQIGEEEKGHLALLGHFLEETVRGAR